MSAVEYEADALAVREENVQAADETGSIHSENTETAEDEFNLEKIIQDGVRGQQERGLPAGKGVSLSWKNLSVRGAGGPGDIHFKVDCGTLLFPWTYFLAKRRIHHMANELMSHEDQRQKEMHWSPGDPSPKMGQPGLRKGQRYLIHDFTGSLNPGEMMLVVGRPGSGCTTFLKALAGQFGAYAGVDGEVTYGAMKAGSSHFRPYASDVMFNSEEDTHDAHLSVGRTMDFALRMEVPAEKARRLDPTTGKPITKNQWIAGMKDRILKALGIAHTHDTRVGNQYVRGVSGGERKRVSIGEAMTTNAQICCWDNATRGLDASSALNFNKVLRQMSDHAKKINILTLYQAGNGIYDLFDKVTVIAEGHVIYYGPRALARPYFEDMGFEYMEGANTADYLTAVTALSERTVKKGYEGRVPNVASEFAIRYRESKIYADMVAEADAHRADTAAREAETEAQKELIHAEKSPSAFRAFAPRASLWTQLWALMIKEVQARWGDKPHLIARQGTTFVFAFICGSVFYNMPDTTAGLFLRGGAVFMIVFFPSILSFSDVQGAFVGRGIIAKQQTYSMYFPGMIILAQTLVDIPMYIFQIVIWTIVMYFLSERHYSATNYFVLFAFSFVVTACNGALFRTIGFCCKNYNDASKIAGTIFMIFVLYCGYIIYTPAMKPWFGWTRFVNPTYYGVEAGCAYMFRGREFLCVAPDLAPYGPGYENGPKGCSVTGSSPGSIFVSGEKYIRDALGFKMSHAWRNFGIIIAFWIHSAWLGMLALTYLTGNGNNQQVTLFKNGGGAQFMQRQIDQAAPRDEEDGGIVTEQVTRYPTGSPQGMGEGLRRWGTTHSEVAPRQWPPLERLSTTLSAHSGTAIEYNNRLQRRATEHSELSRQRTHLEKNPRIDEGDEHSAHSGDETIADHNGEKGTRASMVAGDKKAQRGSFNEKQARSPGTPGSLAQPQIEGTTFTWEDLDYTVKENGKDKQLLRKVSGYCKAGTVTALMGSSGAGKTTLMDVLAARKDEGEIKGHVLLNGRKLPLSFQRTTGYCEQVDVHMPESTVREALEFSALLRQPRRFSRAEKLAYVDEIIDLLELSDIEDAIIGVPGEGLGVEQRKRVTIGVELVSRPTLLFLDEPTSGLDGQSSYMIVGFLQKLAASGQSIMCTIHQPSAALFAGFDMLLLLQAGGRTVYMGPVEDVPNYFIDKGIEWPKNCNPAEYMIDIVSGVVKTDQDWHEVWNNSEARQDMLRELSLLKPHGDAHQAPDAEHDPEDQHEFAATTWDQMYLVYMRANVQLWRNVMYVANKLMLHIITALILGFSFWKIKNSLGDLKNRVFTLFQFAFVAPSVIVQTQPKFIANRDIFEAREKKAKFYSWQVFCFGEITSEFPYLAICAALFWCCWYPATGMSLRANIAGPVFLCMVFYEFMYTGLGQFIAAYAPNAVFAALVVPLILMILTIFCGIIVPYYQLNVFWRYWIYWLDPFTYLMKGLITFPIWRVKVICKPDELGYFNPPAGQTCGQYMADFLSRGHPGYLANPNATENCGYCAYKVGSEYLYGLNIKHRVVGWEGIFLTALFAVSSYALVFILLKLRSKASKTAS